MSTARSRSISVLQDEALRLPRDPGVFRRFWARHLFLADLSIAALCLVLGLLAGGSLGHVFSPEAAAALDVLTPAWVVIACFAILLRRRAPVVPVITAFALELILLLGERPGGTLILLASCYALAVHGSVRAAWIGLGVGVTVVIAAAVPLMSLGVVTPEGGTDVIVNSILLGTIGTLIGANVFGRRRYIKAVIDRSRQLLVERDQQAQLAAANERARIAREMHDIVSHSLTVIVALSEGASATSDREQADAAITATASTARGALQEMRGMLGVLRTDDPKGEPLTPLLASPPHETVANAQRAGYPVTLSVMDAAELCPVVAHAVSRLVQEGVTNAMRHAPMATSISVRIAHAVSGTTVTIVNDGVTDARQAPGFGLRGLTERMAHVHGSIEYGRVGDDRWMLRATVPPTAGTGEIIIPPQIEATETRP